MPLFPKSNLYPAPKASPKPCPAKPNKNSLPKFVASSVVVFKLNPCKASANSSVPSPNILPNAAANILSILGLPPKSLVKPRTPLTRGSIPITAPRTGPRAPVMSERSPVFKLKALSSIIVCWGITSPLESSTLLTLSPYPNASIPSGVIASWPLEFLT